MPCGLLHVLAVFLVSAAWRLELSCAVLQTGQRIRTCLLAGGAEWSDCRGLYATPCWHAAELKRACTFSICVSSLARLAMYSSGSSSDAGSIRVVLYVMNPSPP